MNAERLEIGNKVTHQNTGDKEGGKTTTRGEGGGEQTPKQQEGASKNFIFGCPCLEALGDPVVRMELSDILF